MLIAHDLGTSGDKASLHDDAGRLIAETTASYPTRYTGSNASEQEPRDWWDAVVDTTRRLLATSGVAPARVAGLCVSGHMMGAVYLDTAGESVRPALIWSDQRAVEQAARLSETIGDAAAYAATGHRIGPAYTLPKLMWVRDHEPRNWERVAHVCAAKDYVNLRLTGRLAMDHTDASSTDAYDLSAGAWSDELLGAAGIDADLLPEVIGSTATLGTLTPAAAGALGLPATVRVIAGCGDGPAASVGAGCVAPEDPGYVCLGTSAWYARTTAAPLLDAQRRSFSFRHAVPGLFMPCATTQTGAGALQWLAGVLADGDGTPDVGALLDAGVATDAASGDLFFLPYLLGERTPWWDSAASGTFVGLRMHHRRPHLARAVMEGVGYALALCIEPLDPPAGEPIVAIGGGAGHAGWLQLLADIWGRPVLRRSVTSQANSLGAAVVGLVGLGRTDFAAARSLSSVAAEFEPGAASPAHRERLARFADAYRALAPWFADGQRA